jgi:uncharacterized protein (TIGR02284 family)
MSEVNKQVLETLNYLYRICEAGERGFETVAANVGNRGLKILLKTYAQQRRQFCAELMAEIERLGGKLTMRRSLRGVVHRGRIDIFATLIIGPQNVENMVLNEAALGEQAANRAYKNALAKALPAETRAIVERQYQQVQAVSEQIDRLRGQSGERLVVRLFDEDQDTETAVQALQRAGFTLEGIKVLPLNEVMSVYEGKGSTVTDTVVSGAVGGAIWGSILGAVAGLGILLVPDLQPFWSTTPEGTWGVIALSGTIIGALFGVILGFLIGTGVGAEDAYSYEGSVEHGNTLVMLNTEAMRAEEAARIMQRVNAESRQRRGLVLPAYK